MVDSLEDPRRTDPAFVQDERSMLESWLDWHRTTTLLKCDGLDDAGRKARPIGPSILSLHGLVRHMAEVERNWFRRVLAGEPAEGGLYWTDAHPDGEFELVDEADWEVDLATWQGEIDHARSVAAGRDLDDTGVWRAYSSIMCT